MPQDQQMDQGEFEKVFRVKITGMQVVDGVIRYAWTEQVIDADTGFLIDADSPRSGDTLQGPWLTEINNMMAPLPSYQWAQLRGIGQGEPQYDFSAGAGAAFQCTPGVVNLVTDVCMNSGVLQVQYSAFQTPCMIPFESWCVTNPMDCGCRSGCESSICLTYFPGGFFMQTSFQFTCPLAASTGPCSWVSPPIPEPPMSGKYVILAMGGITGITLSIMNPDNTLFEELFFEHAGTATPFYSLWETDQGIFSFMDVPASGCSSPAGPTGGNCCASGCSSPGVPALLHVTVTSATGCLSSLPSTFNLQCYDDGTGGHAYTDPAIFTGGTPLPVVCGVLGDYRITCTPFPSGMPPGVPIFTLSGGTPFPIEQLADPGFTCSPFSAVFHIMYEPTGSTATVTVIE